MKGGMKKKCDKTYSQTSSESLQSLVAHIETAPTISMNYLKCPLGHCFLRRPVELPCRSHACAGCIITCLTLSTKNICPCCYDNSPLTASSINASPDVFLTLLSDVLLLCDSCKTDQTFQQESTSHMFATLYLLHVKWILRYKSASVIQRMLSESPEPNVFQIPTRVKSLKSSGTVRTNHT